MENLPENDTDLNKDDAYDDIIYDNNTSNSAQPFPNVFALFAKSLGIFSIFCAVFSIFFGAFICGGLAIILAILSKGYEMKMEKNARIGLATGIFALVLQISLFIINIYSLIYIPEFREEFNSIYEEIYGEPVTDSINDLLDEMGIPDTRGGNL